MRKHYIYCAVVLLLAVGLFLAARALRPQREPAPQDPRAFARALARQLPGHRCVPSGKGGYANGFYCTTLDPGTNPDAVLRLDRPSTWQGTVRVMPGGGADLSIPEELGPWQVGDYVLCGDPELAARILEHWR